MTAPNDKAISPPDDPQARAARLAMTFAGFLNMMAALASPRVMATMKGQPNFLACVDAFLDMVVDFRNEGSHSAEPSINEFRGLLATWTPESVVPIDIQLSARNILAALNVPEPPEGWDRFEGTSFAAPTARPRPRVLRVEPMTLKEWCTWQGPGELVFGVLVEEEETTPEHDAVVSGLLEALRAWAGAVDAVVAGPKEKLVVGERSGRKPDIVLYSSDTPALVVEVQSVREVDVVQDLATKPGEYARLGVARLWLVDPTEHHLTCMRLLRDGRYEVVGIYEDGKHAMPDFDGLVIDFDTLWPRGPLSKAPERL